MATGAAATVHRAGQQPLEHSRSGVGPANLSRSFTKKRPFAKKKFLGRPCQGHCAAFHFFFFLLRSCHLSLELMAFNVSDATTYHQLYEKRLPSPILNATRTVSRKPYYYWAEPSTSTTTPRFLTTANNSHRIFPTPFFLTINFASPEAEQKKLMSEFDILVLPSSAELVENLHRESEKLIF